MIDEQIFKMEFLKRYKAVGHYTFCIESERTVKGFPDVLEVYKLENQILNNCLFYEFKVANKSNKIEFQRSQPLFYKKYTDMQIEVVALKYIKGREWDISDVVMFPVKWLFDKDSKYSINGLEVQL